MTTTRTAKLQAEIEKTRAKLSGQQAHLKELEAKRVELENTEVVDIVRGMSIPLDELAGLLQSLKSASGQNVPKSRTKGMEDTTE